MQGSYVTRKESRKPNDLTSAKRTMLFQSHSNAFNVSAIIKLEEPMTEGWHLVYWDGQDGGGRPMPSEVYYLSAKLQGLCENALPMLLR